METPDRHGQYKTDSDSVSPTLLSQHRSLPMPGKWSILQGTAAGCPLGALLMLSTWRQNQIPQGEGSVSLVPTSDASRKPQVASPVLLTSWCTIRIPASPALLPTAHRIQGITCLLVGCKRYSRATDERSAGQGTGGEVWCFRAPPGRAALQELPCGQLPGTSLNPPVFRGSYVRFIAWA